MPLDLWQTLILEITALCLSVILFTEGAIAIGNAVENSVSLACFPIFVKVDVSAVRCKLHIVGDALEDSVYVCVFKVALPHFVGCNGPNYHSCLNVFVNLRRIGVVVSVV